MSAINFPFLDGEQIDVSPIRRLFLKICHQIGQLVNDENQGSNFFCGENLNCIQEGKGFLEFDIKIRKADNTDLVVFNDVVSNEVVRLVKIAFDYTIHDARISISTGTEKELNKFVGPVSTIMRLLTPKMEICSLFKQIIISNHTEANEEIIRGHQRLEYRFCFCRLFKKTTKVLGLALELTTSNRKRNILSTTLGDIDLNFTNNKIYLYIPTIIPSPETQRISKEAMPKTFTLSYESWITDRKPVDTAQEFQLDIGRASNFNAPLNLRKIHHKTQHIEPGSN